MSPSLTAAGPGVKAIWLPTPQLGGNRAMYRGV